MSHTSDSSSLYSATSVSTSDADSTINAVLPSELCSLTDVGLRAFLANSHEVCAIVRSVETIDGLIRFITDLALETSQQLLDALSDKQFTQLVQGDALSIRAHLRRLEPVRKEQLQARVKAAFSTLWQSTTPQAMANLCISFAGLTNVLVFSSYNEQAALIDALGARLASLVTCDTEFSTLLTLIDGRLKPTIIKAFEPNVLARFISSVADLLEVKKNVSEEAFDALWATALTSYTKVKTSRLVYSFANRNLYREEDYQLHPEIIPLNWLTMVHSIDEWLAVIRELSTKQQQVLASMVTAADFRRIFTSVPVFFSTLSSCAPALRADCLYLFSHLLGEVLDDEASDALLRYLPQVLDGLPITNAITLIDCLAPRLAFAAFTKKVVNVAPEQLAEHDVLWLQALTTASRMCRFSARALANEHLLQLTDNLVIYFNYLKTAKSFLVDLLVADLIKESVNSPPMFREKIYQIAKNYWLATKPCWHDLTRMTVSLSSQETMDCLHSLYQRYPDFSLTIIEFSVIVQPLNATHRQRLFKALTPRLIEQTASPYDVILLLTGLLYDDASCLLNALHEKKRELFYQAAWEHMTFNELPKEMQTLLQGHIKSIESITTAKEFRLFIAP